MNIKKLFFGTEPLTQYSMLTIRIVMGILFIHHGQNIFNPADVQETADWLAKELHFPLPLLMADLKMGAMFFGGILLIIGLFTRIAAFFIMFTMLVAWLAGHGGEIFGDGEMSFAYATVMLTILLAGPGRLSLDKYISEK
ncbi:MAG: DoxX family protein [Bacteroidetes bacterium]|nr:DoxX family protein [Bacteroidota bacterium]